MAQEQPDDELIERLEAVERSRRNRTMVIGTLVAIVVGLAFVASFLFADTLFQPKMDIEGGEKEVIESTNDPECRQFIADVTKIGGDYLELEPTLDGLLAEDAEVVTARLEELAALQARLDEARELSRGANLRFDHSRSEVDDWFDYVSNELNVLKSVGRNRLEALEAAGAVDEEGTVVHVDEEEKPKSERPPEKRLEGATLAANEAFQKFRVWHTGGLHPCGAADEGEVAWEPNSQ